MRNLRARDRLHLPQGRARRSPQGKASQDGDHRGDCREFLGARAILPRGGGAQDESGRRHRAGLDADAAATSSSSKRRRMHGKKELILTGHLGDVMKESAQAALSYIRSQAPRRSALTPDFFDEHRHPHPRARRRDPEGRPVGRRHDGHRARLPAHRTPGAPRRGHDRRDHAARQGAAGRRHQGEGARRAPRRHHAPSSCRSATRRTWRTSRRTSARRCASSSSTPSTRSSRTLWNRCAARRRPCAPRRSRSADLAPASLLRTRAGAHTDPRRVQVPIRRGEATPAIVA